MNVHFYQHKVNWSFEMLLVADDEKMWGCAHSEMSGTSSEMSETPWINIMFLPFLKLFNLFQMVNHVYVS